MAYRRGKLKCRQQPVVRKADMAPKGTTRKQQTPDYYALLGVSPGASFREIEAAYWAHANQEENRALLALINQAYEVLGHSGRREAYDATYVPSQEPEPAPEEDPARGNPGLANKLRWYLQ